MKTTKKLWLVALLAMLLVVLFCVAAGAEPVSGTEGEIAWSFETESGVLTVSGTGKMKNYKDSAQTPWATYRDSIQSVVVESGVTSVGKLAFADCAKLASVTLPKGLTAISYGAFQNCVSLTNVSLPSTLKSINYGAFQNCTSLVSVKLPKKLTVLEAKAFAGCSSLKEITLPSGVTELKWGVFEGCTSLTEAPLHEGVKSIDAYAFKDCDSIGEVTVPKNVKNVGGNAFERCASLVKFVISSIKTWISGGTTTIPDNATIHANPNSGGEKYAETHNKTVEIACLHSDVTEKVITPYNCGTSGTSEISCNDCDYVEVVDTDPNHRYEEIPSVLGFVERVCKGECGNRDTILRADETLTLSAFCQETLSFTLEANSSDEVAYVVDGENRGLIDFSADGEATVTIEGLEAAGHTVEFINYSENDVYVKNTAINGAFHRYDTVYEDGVMYLEMLGKEENLEYSDFYAYIRTSDPSGTYYMRYKFDYIHNTTTNDYRANSQTNIGSYRLNGGELVQITETSETSITATVIEVVLGGGEVSLAIRQRNPYMDLIPEGIENQTYGSKNDQYYIYPEGKVEAGQCVEHVGGFHGDEWLSAVALIADGTVIDLKTSDKKVMACNSLLFDLTTTMYAWGTSREGNRGLAFAEHVQNFVINSKGIYHMQEIEWLRGDYDPAGYMPMFTMMRGGLNNRFIDTMRSYDAEGNVVGTYTMKPEAVTSQTNVLADWAGASVVAYEYDGSKGIRARVEFHEANDKVHLGSYIAMRAEANGISSDNKMYAPFSRVNGGMPEQGEVWMVESHYMIDYNSENIQ